MTVAERPLDPADFPGAPPENLVPGLAGVHAHAPARSTCATSTSGGRGRPGACWRHPEGPGSSLDGRDDHPVVHVAYEDAEALRRVGRQGAADRGASGSCAARGGLDGAAFTWGDEPEPPGERLANYWHGDFPWRPDARLRARPRRSGRSRPTATGCYDMAGNVWEWTADWYASPRTPTPPSTPCCVPRDPRGGAEREQLRPRPAAVPRSRARSIKGGSFLCADSYCLRYRPAARRPQMIDTGMSHIGFRCVMAG